MTDQPVKRKPGLPRKSETLTIEVGTGRVVEPEPAKPVIGTGGVGAFNGAPEAAFDHDGDGNPGGSKRKNAGVGKHELEALTREAFEAYDMQDDRIRFDSLARRWEFRMSSESGFWELRLSLARGLSETVDAVPQPVLGGSQGMSVLFDKIAKMDEAVR